VRQWPVEKLLEPEVGHGSLHVLRVETDYRKFPAANLTQGI
jgi:hypothetical protein